MAEVPASQALVPSGQVGWGGKNRNTKLYNSTSTRTGFSNSLTAQLEQFQAAIMDEVLRSAAFAGSDLLYKEMLEQVPEKKGLLKSSLYQWHDDKVSVNGTHIYRIGPNKREAPHWWNVEYGHWRYNKSAGNGKFRRIKDPANSTKKGQQYHTITAGLLKEPRWVMPDSYTRRTADRMPDAIAAIKKRFAEKLKEIQAGSL